HQRRSAPLALLRPVRPVPTARPRSPVRPARHPLAQAFRNDTLNAAGQMQPEPTLPTNVAQTATAVALTSTAIVGTQAALNSQTTLLTATALAMTATASTTQLTPTPTPGGIVSSVPVVNIGCMGDEQMWFVPHKPNIGVHVQISVTSQRHHDAHSMALAGPVDAGPVVEHEGPLGFIQTW